MVWSEMRPVYYKPTALPRVIEGFRRTYFAVPWLLGGPITLEGVSTERSYSPQSINTPFVNNDRIIIHNPQL